MSCWRQVYLSRKQLSLSSQRRSRRKNALFLAFHFFGLPFVKKVVVWKLGDTTRLSGCSLCDLLFKELLCDPSACESFLGLTHWPETDLKLFKNNSRSCHYSSDFAGKPNRAGRESSRFFFPNLSKVKILKNPFLKKNWE